MSKLTNQELRTSIASSKSLIQRTEESLATMQNNLKRREEELEGRRKYCQVCMPHWVFELLSAHARKRHENIAPENRTDNYHLALCVAAEVLGEEVWPRDIPGEHHGSTPTWKSR